MVPPLHVAKTARAGWVSHDHLYFSMRRTSELRPPEYSKKDDPALLRHGPPDVIVLARGHRLFAHSKVLRVYSAEMANLLDNPDKVYGKQLQLISRPGHLRTVEGVTALLNAMYPPQLMPAPEQYHEVYDIAREYNMACPVVFDAFAEFALDEFKDLPGYDGLMPRTKLEIAQRRVALLEQHVAKHCPAARASHPELFRQCPEEVAEEPGAWSPRNHGAFMNVSPWPPWVGGVAYQSPDAANSPSRSNAARPVSAGSVSPGSAGRGNGSPAAGAWRPDFRR